MVMGVWQFEAQGAIGCDYAPYGKGRILIYLFSNTHVVNLFPTLTVVHYSTFAPVSMLSTPEWMLHNPALYRIHQ